MARILGSGNYYEVLALSPAGADEAAVRGAKRRLSLATHPDKIGSAPGAADAFRLVTEVIIRGLWLKGGCEGGGRGRGMPQHDAWMSHTAPPWFPPASKLPPHSLTDRLPSPCRRRRRPPPLQAADKLGNAESRREYDAYMAAAAEEEVKGAASSRTMPRWVRVRGDWRRRLCQPAAHQLDIGFYYRPASYPPPPSN